MIIYIFTYLVRDLFSEDKRVYFEIRLNCSTSFPPRLPSFLAFSRFSSLAVSHGC